MDARKEKKLAKVLEIVNVGRQAMGYKPILKLPKGVPQDATSCPLQRALKVYEVEGSSLAVCDTWGRTDACEIKASRLGKAWHKSVNVVVVNLPQPLESFVAQFDNGEYPELISK